MPSPILSYLYPDSGPNAGGTAVTVIGSNFVEVNVSEVLFDGTPATDFVVVDDGTITCTTPAHANASVEVQLTSTSGPAIPGGAYEFRDPIPVVIGAITPNSGGAGDEVYLNASGLNVNAIPGTVLFDGVPALYNTQDDSEDSYIGIPMLSTGGLVDVTVTNGEGQTDTLVDGFDYTGQLLLLDVVTPNSGPPTGGTLVQLLGDGFLGASSVTIGGVPCTDLNVIDTHTIECVTPANAADVYDVAVHNAGGTDTIVNGFTYAFAGPAPVLETIAPARLPTYGGRVTLTGTDFVDGATVTVGGLPCTDVVFNGSTRMYATVPPGESGTVDIVITNPDAQTSTLTNGFTYAREAHHIAQLLPPGQLWDLLRSKLKNLLLAIGDEFERLRYRALELLEESDPRTATETLEDWERMLSLPDELVLEIPATTAGRRSAIVSKLISRGGQSYSYFEGLCDACGYPLLSIFLYSTLITRSGFHCGDVLYGEDWGFAMRLVLDLPLPGALTEAEFEAVIRAKTHSHIVVTFEYSGP